MALALFVSGMWLKWRHYVKSLCLRKSNEASRMDRDEDSLFSDGLFLANFAVSSNLVQDSWNAISKIEEQINQMNNPVKINELKCPNYRIIAFVTSPVPPGPLQEERDSVSSAEIPNFQFLCSERNPTFHINRDAITLFNSLRNELSRLEKVVTSAKSEGSVPYIITGHRLGGAIASLFTLQLLNMIERTESILLCITFGSPLLGDSAFQEAVSQYSTWNPCFLHVVHKDDSFPRLSICPATTNQSPYKPFGTFLLCSGSSSACFEAPESVMELLPSKIGVGDEESQRVNYKDVIGCLEQRLTLRDRLSLNGQEVDSYEAGIITQVAAVGLKPIQQQDEGTDALIGDIVKHERGVKVSKKEAFDPAKELNQMKVYLAYLEWYMKVCKPDGQGPGYYDSFKNARERRDNGVDKYKTILTNYWERVVHDAEKKPHLLGKPLRNRWLYGGTNYRRIVEPLDIAEHYKRGRKDYIKRGRSKHYILLEKWLKQDQEKKGREQAMPLNSKLENIESHVTEDSCFWARVEEAIRSCRLLNSEGSPNSFEREKLVKFEDYVMDLIKDHAVSPDIFLEKSSYMQWWREYEMLELSRNSQSELVGFMRNDPRKNYIGSPLSVNEERNLNVNLPNTSDSGAPPTREPIILFTSLSRPFLLLLLFIPFLFLLLFHFDAHLMSLGMEVSMTTSNV